MIRKHAFTLIWILVAAMTAAALWRLSLLPDWSRVTMAREDGAPLRSASSAWLFLCPAILAFAAISHARSIRLAQGRPEAVQSLRRYSATLLLAMATIATLVQGVMLGRSLGLALPYEAIARSFFVVLGLLMALFGNRMPKLPWVTSKAVFLDDASLQKIRRINGLWMVVAGAVSALSGLLLQPLHLAAWLVLALTLGGVVAIRTYAFWLKQRQIARMQ
jgi:hypothetical protein